MKDFGAVVSEKQEPEKQTDLRSDRLDREIGVEVGNMPYLFRRTSRRPWWM